MQCSDEGDRDAALRSLQIEQKRTVYSYENLCVAVRRATHITQGRNTPSLDDFVVKTKEDRYRLILIILKNENISKWEPTPVRRT